MTKVNTKCKKEQVQWKIPEMLNKEIITKSYGFKAITFVLRKEKLKQRFKYHVFCFRFRKVIPHSAR